MGFAVFVLETGQCKRAGEFSPPEFRAWIWGRLTCEHPPAVLVVENFRLVYGKAMQQVGSEFGEVRLIGAIEALVDLANQGTKLVMQDPQIRLAADAQREARNVKLLSRGKGGHAKSAELHGLAWIWRNATSA